jgi:uncharacterized damage-inducible protein DinB
MNPILRDMIDHQFWADAVLWNAIGAHEPARDDPKIRMRLHHIHMVQRAFIWRVSGALGHFNASRVEDFPAFDDLRAYALGSHDEIRRWLGAASDEYERSILIPWFRNPPLTLTITEALTQCAMHSHHHRGQNAKALREHGGEPPTTDLIVWYWKEKPPPPW